MKLNSFRTYSLLIFLTFVNSFALAEKQELSQQLLSLPSNGTIPDEVYYKNDVNQIALSLVERLKTIRPSKASEGYYDFFNNSKIQMLFSSRNIEGILQKGFLNSHQTGTGAGAYYQNEQKMMSIENFGRDPNTLFNLNLVVCKYAYLGLTKESPKIWRTRLDPNLYGNVVAVFKDSIKKRTTFTPGNSQMIPESARPLDYKTNEPFPEPHYGKGVWGHHWEAQIWGRLTVDDVDYFMINCPFLKKAQGWHTENLPAERIEALAKAGKPIFQCENDAQESKMYPGARIK